MWCSIHDCNPWKAIVFHLTMHEEVIFSCITCSVLDAKMNSVCMEAPHVCCRYSFLLILVSVMRHVVSTALPVPGTQNQCQVQQDHPEALVYEQDPPPSSVCRKTGE